MIPRWFVAADREPIIIPRWFAEAGAEPIIISRWFVEADRAAKKRARGKTDRAKIICPQEREPWKNKPSFV